MNQLEDIVSQFRVFSLTALEEQKAELKKHNDTHLISGKLARFTVFNANLNKLRQKLDRRIRTIEQDVVLIGIVDYADVDNALKAVYSDILNEYLSINFVRDDHEMKSEQETIQPIAQPVKVGAFK